MIVSRAELLVYLRKADSNLGSADDALIDLIHPLAESLIHNYLQNDLNYQIHTEYLPVGLPSIPREFPLDDFRKSGDRFVFQGHEVGREALILIHTPIALTGLRVWEDADALAGQASGAFGSDTELTYGSDFFLDVKDTSNISTSGKLYRVGGWPTEPRSVKVTYYGGWTASQLFGKEAGVVKLATLKQIAWELRSAKSQTISEGPKVREKIGKYEYELAPEMAMYLSGISGHEVLPEIQLKLQKFRSYKYL